MRLALDELHELGQILTDALTPASATLLPEQREIILRAAREADQGGWIIRLGLHRIPWRRWQVPIAAAAAIMLAAVLFVMNHDRGRHPTPGHVSATKDPASGQPGQNPGSLPAPGPVDAGNAGKPPAAPAVVADPSSGLATADDFPALRVRGFVTAAVSPTLELPVHAGDASLGWITQSILTDRRLPSRNAVRIEEILNHFKLRPDGPSVIARQPASNWHPDDRSPGSSTHAATVATETMACPWQPSATLAIISIRGNPYSDCDVKAVFRANPATISHYRLLGFAPVAGQPQAPLPTRVAAQSSTTLVLEFQPAAATAADFGRIEWSVNGQVAESLTLSPPVEDQAPSADARFAALICTFAQWLADDPATIIDDDMLAALARQNAAAPTLPNDRIDFLNLIERALKL